jgi:hypothetical protein
VERELTHDELQALTGAYALDAVEDDEAEAMELHLMECPRCRAEVAESREVAAFLAHGGQPAPEGLWDRIAGALEEAPPPLDLAPVVPMAPRRSIGLRIVAAVAAAAAVVAVFLGIKVVDLDDKLDRITSQDAVERAARDALFNPRARTIDLRSPGGERTARVVLLPDGTGYLVNPRLPALPPDRTYQLWALVGTSKISAGVLGPDPRTPSPFSAAGEPSGFAITEEAKGGVERTVNQPVAVGTLG